MIDVSNDKLMDVFDVIHRRQSIRSFDTTYSSDKILKNLMDYTFHLKDSPFEGETRFVSLSLKNLNRSAKLRLGTYGFVKGANSFVIGITKDELPFDLENFGYLFEKVILYATHLNIGTVWLGGTFKRSSFASQMNLRAEEKIPAITPVGVPLEKPIFRSRVIRYVSKGEQRRPFSTIFFDGDFSKPLHKSSLNVFAEILEMVRLSPSASNHQPWRVVKEQNSDIFHFFIHRSKSRFQRLFTWPDFKRIDLGIAVCHFDLSVKQLGISGDWQRGKPDIDVPDHCDYLISWFKAPSS